MNDLALLAQLVTRSVLQSQSLNEQLGQQRTQTCCKFGINIFFSFSVILCNYFSLFTLLSSLLLLVLDVCRRRRHQSRGSSLTMLRDGVWQSRAGSAQNTSPKKPLIRSGIPYIPQPLKSKLINTRCLGNSSWYVIGCQMLGYC